MTSPAEQGEDLDFLVLGNALPSPGALKLSGHDRWKNWDIQAAKGATGASSNLNGDPIGTFTASFYLASFRDGQPTGDFENWDNFRRLIESMTNGPTPIALPIYHPDLAENGFTEVSSGGISGAVHDGKGGKTYSVRFLEYRPPKPKPSSKAKAKPAGGAAAGTGPFGPPPPPPQDPNLLAKNEAAVLLAVARAP